MELNLVSAIRKTKKKTDYWVAGDNNHLHACVSVNNKHPYYDEIIGSERLKGFTLYNNEEIECRYKYEPAKRDKCWVFMIKMHRNKSIVDSERFAYELALFLEAA